MVRKGTCDYNFKEGWWCSAEKGHDGPCPLRPEIPNPKCIGLFGRIMGHKFKISYGDYVRLTDHCSRCGMPKGGWTRV